MNRRSFLQLRDWQSSYRINPDSFPDASVQAAARSSRETITSTLSPWVPSTDDWNIHTAGHLYRRAGFGATMPELAAALESSPSAMIDSLLDDSLTHTPNLPLPPQHAENWLSISPASYGGMFTQEQTDYAYAAMAIRRKWAATMSEPTTMLREKMVYFWSNHFVVEAQKVYYPQMLYNYLDYFRRNPWGNFKQMVKDVTILPAMLMYLDGTYSHRTLPNENYARELMELFTLGVSDKDGNANYTEDDIHAMAKALTGYKIDFSAAEPNVVSTIYDVNDHATDFEQPFADAGCPKKLYGLSTALHQIPDDIIDALFQYKGDKLAWFICSKLYQFFVYHDISGSVERDIITALAATFQSNNWELKPLIAQLLKSEHFFDEANIGAEIKSPFEYLISTCRHMNLELSELQAGSLYYNQAVYDAQSLLDPPNVKGWPGDKSWISTTSLPLRNERFAKPLLANVDSTGTSTIAAYGSSGYGENYTAVSLTKANIVAWANQFPDVRGDLNSFIDQLCNFLCAFVPSAELQQSYIRLSLQLRDYEWPGLLDDQRVLLVRQIITLIATLPEFQLN